MRNARAASQRFALNGDRAQEVHSRWEPPASAGGLTKFDDSEVFETGGSACVVFPLPMNQPFVAADVRRRTAPAWRKTASSRRRLRFRGSTREFFRGILTLTLSPGEREQRSVGSGFSSVPRFVAALHRSERVNSGPRRTTILPLPKGEGWGEGKEDLRLARRARFTKMPTR